MFVSPRYSKAAAEEAVGASFSYAEALRRLGQCHTGGSGAILKKYVGIWQLSTSHFDPYARQRRGTGARAPRPLSEVLVEGSSYHRANLKRRLFSEGLKLAACELCEQGEDWHGRRMSLILDHVNGVRDDNRLENLRIVCPNCNATFDTHCGRSSRLDLRERGCERCSRPFQPNRQGQRYCSLACGSRWDRSALRGPRLDARKVARPPYEQIVAEVVAEGWEATGRRYGVSGNSVRNWARAYEAELGVAEGDVLRARPLSSRWQGGRPPLRPGDKLDDTRARAALALLAAGEAPLAVAERLGVSKWCIYTLRRGESHRWLERPNDPRESP